MGHSSGYWDDWATCLVNANNPANIISAPTSGSEFGPNGTVSYNEGNNLTSTFGYDALGRLNSGCVYTTSSNCTSAKVYGFSNTWNGVRLTSSVDSVLGQTATYGYDEFNRIASRTITAGTVQNFAYVYDRWGNRWNQNVTAGSGPAPSYTFNTANNHITTAGYAYDAAGNMTNDGFHTYTYDAEGHTVSVDGGATATYVYNALNQRVETTVGSTVKEFVYNFMNQRTSVWNGSTLAMISGHYYLAGKPVAYYTNGGSTVFLHQNWLRTVRMRTTYVGAQEGTTVSLPFGDGLTITGADGATEQFAQLDYDPESNTYHAQMRQYSSTQGRWLSSDPYLGSYSQSDPQSTDRYAYVKNNPLGSTDRSGLDDDDGCDDDSGGGGGGSSSGSTGSDSGGDTSGGISSFQGTGGTDGGGDTGGDTGPWPPDYAGPCQATSTSPQSDDPWVNFNGDSDLSDSGSSNQGSYNCGGGSSGGGGGGNALVATKTAPNNGCSVSASSLDNYLSTENSPIAGQGANLMASGAQYNIDPRLFVSLAGAETTFGNNITAGQFNAFNVLYHGMNSPFSSYQSAINSVGHSLTNPRNGYDFTNTATLYGHYCSGAGCAAGLKNLNTFMNQQGANTSALHYPCKKE